MGVEERSPSDKRHEKTQEKATANVDDKGAVGKGYTEALRCPTTYEITSITPKNAAKADDQILHPTPSSLL
jgi:hypothetical protein